MQSASARAPRPVPRPAAWPSSRRAAHPLSGVRKSCARCPAIHASPDQPLVALQQVLNSPTKSSSSSRDRRAGTRASSLPVRKISAPSPQFAGPDTSCDVARICPRQTPAKSVAPPTRMKLRRTGSSTDSGCCCCGPLQQECPAKSPRPAQNPARIFGNAETPRVAGSFHAVECRGTSPFIRHADKCHIVPRLMTRMKNVFWFLLQFRHAAQTVQPPLS